MPDDAHRRCWCGNTALLPFGADYWHCTTCDSLVAGEMPSNDIALVTDDAGDLYGRSYWYELQEQVHGYANIEKRARLDLPERCLHWLRTLLKYKRPPARVLELGSAHGGFVALLHWAGFDAAGLELSPQIVAWASSTFDVPVLKGAIEQQDLPLHSFDVIALMDVLEHLPDPVATIKHCFSLLREDGCMIVQTPNFPAGSTYTAMLQGGDPFLAQLKPREHLFLFSGNAAAKLFQDAGAAHCSFESAIFSHYDQFFVASRCEPPDADPEVDLASSPSGRMVQALLDLEQKRLDTVRQLEVAEADRAARLEVIKAFAQRMEIAESDRAAQLEVIKDFAPRLAAAEVEREANAKVLRTLAQRLDGAEALLETHAVQQKTVEDLAERLLIVETDRDAQREVAQDTLRRLETAEAGLSCQRDIARDFAERLERTQADQRRLSDEVGQLRIEHEHIQADQAALIAEQSQRLVALQSELALLNAKCAQLEADGVRHAETANVQASELDSLRHRLNDLTREYQELSSFVASLRRSFAGRTLEKLGMASFPIKGRAGA